MNSTWPHTVNWKRSSRGFTAEVQDGDQSYLIHALKDEKQEDSRIEAGNCFAASRRLKKEGGPRSFLERCTRPGAPCRSVSAPCLNHEDDGGDKVFLMLVEEDRPLEIGDTHALVEQTPERLPPVIGLIDVEEFVRRKGCSPTDGREYLAAQRVARGVQLEDFTARSVWEIAKEEGGYVRDVLEKRYRAIHARGRDLREEELAAIQVVAEEPPLEPLDLSKPGTGKRYTRGQMSNSVPPAFEAMEKALGMDPRDAVGLMTAGSGPPVGRIGKSSR